MYSVKVKKRLKHRRINTLCTTVYLLSHESLSWVRRPLWVNQLG